MAEDINRIFFLHPTAPCLSQIVLKFGLNWLFNPFLPKFWPSHKVTHPDEFSVGDIWRQIAAEWLDTAYRKPPSLTSHPYDPPILWKLEFSYIRAMSPFAKLLWPLYWPQHSTFSKWVLRISYCWQSDICTMHQMMFISSAHSVCAHIRTNMT